MILLINERTTWHRVSMSVTDAANYIFSRCCLVNKIETYLYYIFILYLSCSENIVCSFSIFLLFFISIRCCWVQYTIDQLFHYQNVCYVLVRNKLECLITNMSIYKIVQSECSGRIYEMIPTKLFMCEFTLIYIAIPFSDELSI